MGTETKNCELFLKSKFIWKIHLCITNSYLKSSVAIHYFYVGLEFPVAGYKVIASFLKIIDHMLKMKTRKYHLLFECVSNQQYADSFYNVYFIHLQINKTGF